MNRMGWILVAGALAACSTPPIAAVPADFRLAARPIGRAVSLNAIVIRSSGSTNTWGYTIIVGADGRATYTQSGSQGSATIPGRLASRIVADVRAAQPLDHLPAGRCMKSVSFGTTLTVESGGHTSPDLTCMTGRDERRLAGDAAAIAHALGVSNGPRSGPAPRPLPQL